MDNKNEESTFYIPPRVQLKQYSVRLKEFTAEIVHLKNETGRLENEVAKMQEKIKQLEIQVARIPENSIGTVLVVDDNKLTRKVLDDALTAGGYEVVVAEDGIEGLAILKTQPVDVVVTDLNMPHMDGFEMIQQIRADTEMAKLPVIVCTILRGESNTLQAAKLGVKEFITKPVTQKELLLKVDEVFSDTYNKSADGADSNLTVTSTDVVELEEQVKKP